MRALALFRESARSTSRFGTGPFVNQTCLLLEFALRWTHT